MVSIGDIRQAYYAEGKDVRERMRLVQYWVIRPLSFYVTCVCAKLCVSPNVVTLVSFLYGVSGLVLLALGGYANRCIGFICLLLWLLFDSVDGNLARYIGKSSRVGQLLDILNDHIVFYPVFMLAGFGAFLEARSGGMPFRWFARESPALLLFLGAWASLLAALSGLIYRTVAQEVLVRVEDELDGEGVKSGTVPLRPVVLLGIAVIRWSDFILPIGLLAAILNRVDLYLMFYALSNSALLAGLCVSLLKAVNRMQ